jgi:hypothetical protein
MGASTGTEVVGDVLRRFEGLFSIVEDYDRITSFPQSKIWDGAQEAG